MPDFLSSVTIFCCFALALNIGGNNSACEMAPAYGARARTKRDSLILVAIFSLIGAITAGNRVVQNLSSGITSMEGLSGNAVAALTILVSAGFVVGLANYLRLPIATSHATVAAIVGFGLKRGPVLWHNVSVMVVWWVLTPLLSLLFAFFVGKLIYRPATQEHVQNIRDKLPHSRRLVNLFLTATGCFLSYSAGSNGLAKAIGPLVGAKILDVHHAFLIGALGLSLGAILIGSRVLETVSQKIARVDTITAVCTELICGAILLSASLAGIPVSVSEVITASVLGFAAAQSSIRLTWQNKSVTNIFQLALVGPVLSAGISYILAVVFFP